MYKEALPTALLKLLGQAPKKPSIWSKLLPLLGLGAVGGTVAAVPEARKGLQDIFSSLRNALSGAAPSVATTPTARPDTAQLINRKRSAQERFRRENKNLTPFDRSNAAQKRNTEIGRRVNQIPISNASPGEILEGETGKWWSEALGSNPIAGEGKLTPELQELLQRILNIPTGPTTRTGVYSSEVDRFLNNLR